MFENSMEFRIEKRAGHWNKNVRSQDWNLERNEGPGSFDRIARLKSADDGKAIQQFLPDFLMQIVVQQFISIEVRGVKYIRDLGAGR